MLALSELLLFLSRFLSHPRPTNWKIETKSFFLMKDLFERKCILLALLSYWHRCRSVWMFDSFVLCDVFIYCLVKPMYAFGSLSLVLKKFRSLRFKIAKIQNCTPRYTCCFVLLVGLTEMWQSFMARSIRVTVYGLFVSGLTHLSATIVAISLNIISCWLCRSFSDTCSSPLARIWN